LAVERTLFGKVRDVRTGDERLGPRPGEDRTPDRVLCRYSRGRVGQLVHDLVVQGVELVGAVDGDGRDGVAHREQEGFVAHGENLSAEGRMRNAEFQWKVEPPSDACPQIQHSALRIRFRFMPVQAIAWSPTGAVRIIDQRALPEARIERDLESAEAVAEAIRTLQVRGAPLIGIAAAMGLVAGTRELRGAPREQFLGRVAELARLLATSRPTAVNLRGALDRMTR